MLFKRVSDLSLVPTEEKEFVTGEWDNSDKLYVIDLKSTSADSAIFSKMEASGLISKLLFQIYSFTYYKLFQSYLFNK